MREMMITLVPFVSFDFISGWMETSREDHATRSGHLQDHLSRVDGVALSSIPVRW